MNTAVTPASAKPHPVRNASQAATIPLKRRQFLKSAAFAGASALILPRIKLFGKDAPSNKLNIALIATGHRAKDHFAGMAKENIVAICDVNQKNLDAAAEKFPKATKYEDWRKCLDQKDIDAIVCCTPDHTHAFINNWALNRDKHIYCEKPMAIGVEETRSVRANWLKHKHKVATQVGTQRHEMANFNRVRELIQDGAIGKLTEVSAWGNRKADRTGFLPAEPVPSYLNWDLWVGPAPFHPFNATYIKGGCLNWNMYWDFGCGQVGDMGSHTMDLAWNALDATLPTSAEAKGDPFNADMVPVKAEMHWEIPANKWRSAITVSWYEGGALPESPNRGIDLSKIDHGVLFEGSQGALVADFSTHIIIPSGKDADMTYYKPRTKANLIPPMGNFEQQWIKACKGDLKTSCDFGYSSDMTEMMLLGLVAYRAGKKIHYDGATGQVTDSPEANELLSRKYRDGWTLNG
jgi:predicted dehydrogenase